MKGFSLCVVYYLVGGFFLGVLSNDLMGLTTFLDKAVSGSIIGLLSGCNFGVAFASITSILTTLLTYVFRAKLTPQKGMRLGLLLGTFLVVAISVFYYLALFFYFEYPVLDRSYLVGNLLLFVIPGLLTSIGVGIANRKMLRDYEIK